MSSARRDAQRWSRQLENHVRAVGLESPDLVLCNPFIAGFGTFPWARSVTYFSTDDYATGAENRRWASVFEAAYREMATKQRSIAAVAPVILERIASPGPSIVLPNGVDEALWGPIPVVPTEMARFSRPVAVYCGVLQGRIDPGALREISAVIGSGSVVLVGPERGEETRQAARGLANVHFVGAVSPADIPGWVRGADLALVPHVETAVTRGMSPLKVYEYLAAGLPVVATDLQPMRGISDRVILARLSAGSFASATKQALKLPRADEEARLNFIAENGWSRRAQTLLEFCRHDAPRGGL